MFDICKFLHVGQHRCVHVLESIRQRHCLACYVFWWWLLPAFVENSTLNSYIVPMRWLISLTLVNGILQVYKLASYLFIVQLDCVLRTFVDLMKENGLTKNARSKRHHGYTITNYDYADYFALLGNEQVECLLRNMKQAARDTICTWTQIKQSSWVYEKMEPCSHHMASVWN